MLLTYGTTYVGKVDVLKGHGYVVTRAFHLLQIPLIPLGGYWVQEGSEVKSFFGGVTSFKGVPIPIQWKSFGWAWARIGLFCLGVFGLLGILPALLHLPEHPFIFILGPPLGLPFLAILWFTRKGLRGSPERLQALRSLSDDWTDEPH